MAAYRKGREPEPRGHTIWDCPKTVCSGFRMLRNSFSISGTKATRRMGTLLQRVFSDFRCTNPSQVPRRHNEPDLHRLGLGFDISLCLISEISMTEPYP